MAVFEEARQDVDRKVVVKLLTTLAENPETTQRDLATEMGISLGMMVSYMKSCIHKGFVRSKQVSPKRWAYFVTPKGFTEKSIMATSYLCRAMTFYRDTRIQLEELFESCKERNIKTVALIGVSEVSEIATLVAKSFALELVLYDTNSFKYQDLQQFDAVLITDIVEPQNLFDSLKKEIKEERLLSIPILCIARKRVVSASVQSGKV